MTLEQIELVQTEIGDAMNKIINFCNRYENCEGCPLADTYGYCVFQDSDPKFWKEEMETDRKIALSNAKYEAD